MMEYKKSIVYIGCDIPSGNASSIRVFSNALALRDYGYKVYILSFDHGYSGAYLDESVVEGITVLRTSHPSTSKEYAKYLVEKDVYLNAIKRIQDEHNEIQAVIAYDQPGISFIRVLNWCRKNRIAYLCDCAEWHTAVHLKGIARMIKELDIFFSMRFAYKLADGVIAISSFLEKYYNDSTKVIRIPPLQNEKVSLDVSTNTANDIVRFIYAGVPGKDKDCLDIILRAFANVQNQNFGIKIFGLTEQQCVEVWPETEKHIRSIRNGSIISFEGRVPHHVILAETTASDYSLIIRRSSRKNNAGFPTKFAESIECGTPVVANNFSDVFQYIGQNGFGIQVNDIDCLENALTKAITAGADDIRKMKMNCYYSNAFNYKSYTQILGDYVSGIVRK